MLKKFQTRLCAGVIVYWERKGTRKKVFVDESRIWNFAAFNGNTIGRSKLRSFMFGYFWYDDIAESHFGINQRNPVRVLRDLKL